MYHVKYMSHIPALQHYIYNITCTLQYITCMFYITLYITCPFYITESSSDKVVSSNDGPKENAVWPFQSVKEKTLDEEANLPPPQIDEVTGIYCLIYSILHLWILQN